MRNQKAKPLFRFYDMAEQARAFSEQSTQMRENVNHPAHYLSHPSGIECIEVAEHMGFNLGNALKYIWRCDLKRDAIEDLRKAAWYIGREIQLRERQQPTEKGE